MIRHRGISGPVMAMARPARPAVERQLVRAAAAEIEASGRDMTKGQLARVIARRVIAEVLRDFDSDPADVVAMLRSLRAGLQPSPIVTLATSPEVDTAALIRRARLDRFEAAGCRILSASEWQAENGKIAEAVTATLAGRYFRCL